MTYNDSRFRPIMSARQGLTGTKNTTGRYSKLKMPVIDAEAQAVTLTSPRTTEKVLSYQTANLPTLEKSKSAWYSTICKQCTIFNFIDVHVVLSIYLCFIFWEVASNNLHSASLYYFFNLIFIFSTFFSCFALERYLQTNNVPQICKQQWPITKILMWWLQ